VIILRGDMENYSRHSQLITDIIADSAPLYEKASIDEFYLDLSGMDRYIGCYQWANDLRQKVIGNSGLPISFGLAVNKLISKMSTSEVKPNGAIQVVPGTEKGYIAPFAVSKLPSVGRVTTRKLSLMGVRSIRVLSEIPVKLLQREFGKTGISLSKKANAIDHTPVVPYIEQKSMSNERTFQTDTINVRKLKTILNNMLCKLTFELRSSQKLTSCITVKIRYADFNTYTKQKRIPYTANDRILATYLNDLFDQLYQRRQLVRLVGIRFSGLVHGSYQINLFEDTIKETKLMEEMDKIRKRFGAKAVMRGSGI